MKHDRGRASVVCLWLGALWLLFYAPMAIAEDAVKVDKAAPVVEYKRFDPAHLPDPPPPLAPGEQAVCVYRFEMNVNGRYRFDDKPADKPPVKAEIQIAGVSIDLALKITIWLPNNSPKSLEAHEEGHRQIAEAFYAEAEKTARALAEKVIDQKASGEGENAKSAAGAAMESVNQKLIDDYLKQVDGPCEKAQAALDTMTNHGRRDKPAAVEAVVLALKKAREKQDH